LDNPPSLNEDVILVAVAASVLLTIGLAVARALKIRRRAARVLAARDVGGAGDDRMRDGELVLVRGKARTSDAKGESTTATPLTKRPVLWWRLTVRGETHRPGMMMWNNLLAETGARDFVLEDGKGKRVRVAIAAMPAMVLVVSDRVEKTLCMDGQKLRDDVRGFLSSRADLADAVGADGLAAIAVRTLEEILAAGDELQVIGVVEGGAIVPGADGLIVAHGDVKEHAKSGRVWARGPDA